MPNSWKKYESCVDIRRPMSHAGKKATYKLVLKNPVLESKKIDADELKRQQKITHKIADAFFFVSETSGEKREKVIIVETKGGDLLSAIKQLETCHAMLLPLKIEINGRIVLSKTPAAITYDRQYLALQKLFGGKVQRKNHSMTETYLSFEQHSIA